jgi:hypothetical protein
MIRNTAEMDPLERLITAMDRGGIEASEARGQRELAASSQLPADGMKNMPSDLGIVVNGPSDGDPLFVNVTLPDGWTIKPTDHSMWSDLLNASGVKVASIFYKAAFYDRSAFIRWS